MKIDIYSLAKRIVLGVSVVMLIFLGILSFFYSSDGYTLSLNEGIRPFITIVVLTLFFILLVIVSKKYSIPKHIQTACEILVFGCIMFFCGWWVINSNSMPSADQQYVYEIAVRAFNNDFLPIAPTGSYMSLWPYQAGLLLYDEIILSVIPNANELTIQWVNVGLMALSLISAYMTVKKLFPSRKVRAIWCLLMALFIPYYLYTNYMYGEVPSIAMMFFALWMMAEYLQRSKNKWFPLLLAGVGIAGAVAFRQNSLMFVVAACIVLATLFLCRRKANYIILLFVLITATMFGNCFPRAIYEKRANNILGEGVPTMAGIAMGLRWDEGRQPGAWSDYNYSLFMECDYDGELTTQISKQAVKESLKYMLENPDYMFTFFYEKIKYQWLPEDYLGFYITLNASGERTEAAWDIYKGTGRNVIMWVLEVQQSAVFIGAIIYCMSILFSPKALKQTDLLQMVLLVTFIGGFLFSLVWEGNSRYVMPYFLMLIPYASDGYCRAIRWINERSI